MPRIDLESFQQVMGNEGYVRLPRDGEQGELHTYGKTFLGKVACWFHGSGTRKRESKQVMDAFLNTIEDAYSKRSWHGTSPRRRAEEVLGKDYTDRNRLTSMKIQEVIDALEADEYIKNPPLEQRVINQHNDHMMHAYSEGHRYRELLTQICKEKDFDVPEKKQRLGGLNDFQTSIMRAIADLGKGGKVSNEDAERIARPIIEEYVNSLKNDL